MEHLSIVSIREYVESYGAVGRHLWAPGFLFPAQAPDGLLRRLDPCSFLVPQKMRHWSEKWRKRLRSWLTSSGSIMFSGRNLPYCRLIGRTNASDHPFLRGRASTDPEIGSIKCSSRESSPNREKKNNPTKWWTYVSIFLGFLGLLHTKLSTWVDVFVLNNLPEWHDPFYPSLLAFFGRRWFGFGDLIVQ